MGDRGFSRTPAIRIFILLSIGVVISNYSVFPRLPSIVLLLVFGVLIFSIQKSKKAKYNLLEFSIGLLLSILLIFTGIKIYGGNSDSLDEKSLHQFENQKGYFILKNLESIEDTSESWENGRMELQAISLDSIFIEIDHGVSVVLERKDPGLKAGDMIIAYGLLKRLPKPFHKDVFDYSRYLKQRGIHFQLFLGKSDYHLLCSSRNMGLREMALASRASMERRLLNSHITPQNSAFLFALILGDRDFIEGSRIERFRDAGVMHIMAVSGLHVGTLYFILNLIAGILMKLKFLKYLRVPFILISLWAYCFITGLSPSVMRASLVISLIIIGKSAGERVNTFNLLASSAILLIIYKPFYLADLGFQLSYLAVTGILLIQPLIYRSLAFKNRIIDRIWSLCAVSISAQIATLPLTLSNFHQFPTYFLLSNLVVIPLVTVIFYGGLLLLILSFSPIVTLAISFVLNLLIELLDGFLGIVQGFPSVIIDSIYFPGPLVYLSYLFLGFFILRLMSNNHLYSYLTFVSLILSIEFISKQRRSEKAFSQFNTYHFRNELVTDIIHDSSNTLLVNEKNIKSSQNLLSMLQPIYLKAAVEKTKVVGLDSTYQLGNDFYSVLNFPDISFIKFGTKSIIYSRKYFSDLKSNRLKCDYLICSPFLIENNLKLIDCDTLLLSYSCNSPLKNDSILDLLPYIALDKQQFQLRIYHSNI